MVAVLDLTVPQGLLIPSQVRGMMHSKSTYNPYAPNFIKPITGKPAHHTYSMLRYVTVTKSNKKKRRRKKSRTPGRQLGASHSCTATPSQRHFVQKNIQDFRSRVSKGNCPRNGSAFKENLPWADHITEPKEEGLYRQVLINPRGIRKQGAIEFTRCYELGESTSAYQVDGLSLVETNVPWTPA